MAGTLNSGDVSRSLSGDSTSSLFDDNVPNTTTTSSNIPQRPARLHTDHFNGFQAAVPLLDRQPSGTLLDGILQNLSLWDSKVNRLKYCTCSDGIQATSYCSVCKDYLCEKCVSAHSRVKVTRDHPIEKMDSSSFEQPSGRNDGITTGGCTRQLGRPFKFTCDVHVDNTVHLYCESCSMPICEKCALLNHSTGHRIQYLQQIIDGSRTVLGSLIAQSRTKIDSFTQLSANILTRIKTLDMQANDACSEIQAVFHEIYTSLEKRQRELMASVQQRKQVKFQTLHGKFDEICEQSSNLKKLTDSIQRECEFSNGVNVITAKERLTTELTNAERALSKNAYFDDDSIIFVPPDGAIITAISNLGKVATRHENLNMAISRAPHTMASNLSSLVIGQHLPRLGDMTGAAQNSVKEQSVYLPHQMLEKQDESFSIAKPITFEDNRPGVSNELREILRGPPPPQTVRVSKPRLSFGGMGERDGQLCRPWGVACDRAGNFVVADRSNNRIQVFSPDGSFVRKFGVAGSQPGQFNRPAGLSVDVHDRVVVADKDNHRIQVFSLDGDFLFTFGDRGSKNSQFYYPWDVATDSKGLIAVTDTRNHRIQIFDPNGKFLGKYGFEGVLWKHFDSPRGIYFTNNDANLVVTDFNNHRLVIIPSDLQSARFLGAEGFQPSQFMRPQGVAVDKHGNYIVADSRNNRLQVFSPAGNVIVIVGGQQGGNGEEMDRPSGLAVSPDGGIVVVDFGNNRVLVY